MVFGAESAISIAGLVGTVEGLRAGLRSRGSDLIVLRGPLDERLPELAAVVGAQQIVTEVEVEFRHAARARMLPSVQQGFGAGKRSVCGGPFHVATGNTIV